jgi:hypothetical protein
MAISFVGATSWGNVGGSASGVASQSGLQPVAGDQLVGLGYMVETGGTASESVTWSSNISPGWTAQGALQNPISTDWAQWSFSNGRTGAVETDTVTGAGTGITAFWVDAFELEYRGIAASGTSQNISSVSRAGPGTGSGAILGTSVTVPAGSILLAFCTNRGNHTNAISSPSGTTRRSGTSTALLSAYCITEYAGAGSAIQPSFTDSVNGGTDTYVVVQIILNPSSLLADDADVSVFQWIQESNETGDELWEAVFDSRPVDPLKIGQFFNTEVEM